MSAKDIENRVFVGGLSGDVSERDLEDAFRRFGKVIDCQIMVERDTGRPRGFGFLTFSDRCGMEDAIREMHGREFFDRVISVNKAEPKPGDDSRDDYSGGYPSGPRRGYRESERSDQSDECFKCGRVGHWARDCPPAGGGGGLVAPYSSRSRYEDRGGCEGRFVDRDHFLEDRYSGGRYGERDTFDNRDKYGSCDRFDRYPPGGDRYGSDRYRDSDRYPLNGYEKERGYEQDGGRRRGTNRYAGGGPIREVGRGYSDRPAPYDPPRGRFSSYDRY